MIILGIETSCDETSAAVLRFGKVVAEAEVLSNKIHSQIQIHKPFGGVVPELASRDHLIKIAGIVKSAIEEGNVSLQDINGIAVTVKPGLIGALLVGLSFAKGLAYANHIPFIGINHLDAHLYSVFLEHHPSFPFIGLTISGGHTSLFYVSDFFNYKILGKSYDDAAGEAYDKVAKHLQLGYPGGPLIEKLAEKGDQETIHFPRPLMKSKKDEDRFNFSFSGLKSSVVHYHSSGNLPKKEDMAASFQAAMIDILTSKLKQAAIAYKCNTIVMAGGVACNKALRNKVFEVFDRKDYNVFIPSKIYCTDNAAMIAFLGGIYLKAGFKDNISLGASSKVT